MMKNSIQCKIEATIQSLDKNVMIIKKQKLNRIKAV